MIACIIEFGIKPGKEEKRDNLLEVLIPEAKTLDGFISKETFESHDNPGKIITISYWKDETALEEWMENAKHRAAIDAGKGEILSEYDIRIAEVQRSYEWEAEE